MKLFTALAFALLAAAVGADLAPLVRENDARGKTDPSFDKPTALPNLHVDAAILPNQALADVIAVNTLCPGLPKHLREKARRIHQQIRRYVKARTEAQRKLDIRKREHDQAKRQLNRTWKRLQQSRNCPKRKKALYDRCRRDRKFRKARPKLCSKSKDCGDEQYLREAIARRKKTALDRWRRLRRAQRELTEIIAILYRLRLRYRHIKDKCPKPSVMPRMKNSD